MASYFQGLFQASSMPKRLLQYALSRLEILDTDALDIKNLDIAWGKNSTFEFKDVGLRLVKLETLLQLPPSFEILKARVLLLRLTIPVDIYSSPIVVEIEGVDCQLRIKATDEKGPTSIPHTNHDRKRNRHHIRTAAGTSDGHSNGRRARRGSNFEEDADTALPTAADLAQSFLQTEAVEDRAELEAAILSQTQDLGNSVMSEDGDIPTGTGAGLGLPGFVASFLQGIVDRLEVQIHGVTINLDIDVPTESSRSTSHTTDPVTLQLRVANIDIEGVTDQSGEVAAAGKLLSEPLYKKGKRLICLNKLRGVLISEANLFTSLARSSALSSPSAAHSDVFEDRKASRSYASTHGSTFRSFDEASSSEVVSAASSRRLSNVSVPALTQPLHGSVVASDSGRFEDAPEDEERVILSRSRHEDVDSEAGDSIFQSSAYLDQISDSQYSDNDANTDGPSLSYLRSPQLKQRVTSPLSTPRASLHLLPAPNSPDLNRSEGPTSDFMLQSTILPSRQHPRLSQDRVSHSQPSFSRKLSSHVGAVSESVRSSEKRMAENAIESEDDNIVTPVGEEDLAESQLFSHEEAESMYMSAVSYGSSVGKMPGGWEGSGSGGSDGPLSTPGSPIAPGSQHELLDNLEHARSAAPIQLPMEQRFSAPSSPSDFRSLHTSGRVASPSPIKGQRAPVVNQVSSSVSEPSTASSDDYVKMAKEIFSMDHVAIHIPDLSSEPCADSRDISLGGTMLSNTFDNQRDASRPASVNVPGAFSNHLPTSSRRYPLGVKRPAEADPVADVLSDTSVEVDVGQLLLQFDISVARLLFKLVEKVKDALNKDCTQLESPKGGKVSADPELKVTAQKISLQFLEKLEGTSGPVPINFDDTQKARGSSEALLRTEVSGLLVDSRASKSISETIVKLKKFAFGYAQENIISFDAGLQVRASIRDLQASDGVDVVLKIIKSANNTRLDVTTLPMHVAIDLQRLDDTFSWFGGLSSVLNMGSSIASNATVTGALPSNPKLRGVRFEAPIKPDDKSLAAQNKADIRIGGFVLDLVGAECSIGVETSSVKIVSRDEGIGVAIHKILLSGPHLKHSNENPAIAVDVTATRIEFLSTPKDVDLDRLLSLITPSKAKYDQDDDILLDTLLRQRKQGAVLRVTIDDLQARVSRINDLSYLPDLGEEISRLSTVAKYLPDDDRPGLLSLITVRKCDGFFDVDRTLGTLTVAVRDFEVAQISLPALVALSVGTVSLYRNVSEELLGPASNPEQQDPRSRSPSIMARMIGNEMEPVVKIKLWNLKVEYRVPTLITLLGLAESATSQDISASLTASVATLTDLVRNSDLRTGSKATLRADKPGNPHSKPMRIDVVLRDCIIGLNPLGLSSKILIVLTETHLAALLPKDQNASANAEMGKGSILVIDNVANIMTGDTTARSRRPSFDGGSTQIADLCATGFVSVSYISSARVVINLAMGDHGDNSIDVELRDDLFVLESCADSTQTLIATLNALAPPTPPSKEIKYRTKVIPVQDLLASLSGDAFGTAEGDYNFDDDFGLTDTGDIPEVEEAEEFHLDSHYYQNQDEPYNELLFGDESGSVASTQLTTRDTQDGVLLDSFVEQPKTAEEDDEPLEFQEDHFGTGSILEGTAHRWDSAKNTYDKANTNRVKKSPLKVCVRDVHIIWNLFDGYDWQHTRDTITKAVQDVESKAIERRARNERRPAFEQDIEDEDTVIGDFLFNSIYIGVPANRDPRELATAINQELHDNVTETESIATTTVSSAPGRSGGSRRTKPKNLRLNRSRHHKITFELKGISVDLVVFPPGSGETQSSIDVRVYDFDIFDHVPTSTWRKFATYMQDAGERETGTSMIHIEILNVKPVPELAASEIVLKATVLPLRLHVDQDALDFITRFFEFKDDSSAVPPSSGDVPFLQRVEVNSIQVKLDFKPKRVDYAGLRSGHTTEFMNFLILDEADMVLRHTIIYGISGFDKMGKCLNDIWMPDIKRNQLPGILAGLAPVRSIVNVGGGLRQLVVVPYREYQKDQRIARSLTKGAAAFARTTGTELVKLGAKVAIGVQTVLQGAEGFLGPNVDANKFMETDDVDEESKQISLYANQPVGVLQGLRGGYDGLQRDLILARDAIIAVPGEVMESGTAAGVMRAVRKHAPTVILRPAIGVAKAGGQILMGATNSLDPVNLQRADAKYKRH